MSVNPYTLNCLVEKGILDYVPIELLYQTPIVGSQYLQNPYMNMAMSGNLYQQSSMDRDTFIYGNSGLQYNTQAGNPVAGGLKSMFGFNGIGNNTNNGLNMFGEAGVGRNSNVGLENTFGGFNDVKGGISQGVNSFWGLHPIIKGLIAAPLLFFALAGCFKSKKKPKTKKGSMLNPMNWFKKPKPEPVKRSFWSKLIGKK